MTKQKPEASLLRAFVLLYGDIMKRKLFEIYLSNISNVLIIMLLQV